ncbi:MAG TPA: hypothetical protein VK750_01340 [Cytophagaceae bacterium]|nr:hypothetical protein [Cytophagaceae bacterium]
MRKFLLYVIIISFIQQSCTEKSFEQRQIAVDSSVAKGNKEVMRVLVSLPEYCTIDTVKIEERYYEKLCFSRELSEYPKIKGPGDWSEINRIIKDTIDHFIDQAKLNTECLDDSLAPKYMGWANTTFEVLNNDSNYICIKLDLTSGFGGGNMWIPETRVFIIGSKNKTVIPGNTFIKTLDREEVNSIIYTFFNNQFPKEVKESIGHEFIKNNKDFESMEYGIRNDSLVLSFPAYPSGHFSYTVYTVPLKKLK